MKTKLEVPHRNVCSAMAAVNRGEWGSPWWMPMNYGDAPKNTVHRDAIGRKGGSRRWIVLRCNSSVNEPCPAVMLVEEDSFYELVPTGADL